MSKSNGKIELSSSRDIPFNKLVLSQSNVRRIKQGVSVEELAEDIARRTLLQSLTVRPVRDADGNETGMYEIPAGGRRYRALELLVKQKRLAKNAPIPCVVREGGIAEEDSLAENIQRAPLHPLDQFRAFLALREKGQSEEEIAAAFFVSVGVVRQRLRLAAVSPRLLDIYAEDGLTLDQLMAFTVNGDHERQEQVYDRISFSCNKEPHAIRRMLTEGAVRASNKRVQFIGLETYEEAGGTVLRDLFESDDGGWLKDVALVDRLVSEKLQREADAIRAEGWKWVEVAPDFPYGHNYGLRQISGESAPFSADEQDTLDALRAEQQRLEETYAEADELPEEVDNRLAEIETALAALEDRPLTFDPADVARAGAFVSISNEGQLRIERGFVRPEDEAPIEPDPGANDEHGELPEAGVAADAHPADGAAVVAEADSEEDEGPKPLSDRLTTELTTYWTLGLRHALGQQPEMAFLAVLHALCLKLFYRYGAESCLDIEAKSVVFTTQGPGLADCAMAIAIDARHRTWVERLPKDTSQLWESLIGFDDGSKHALFAHCVSLTVNAVYESWNRRVRPIIHSYQLAEALDLDMVASGWTPTVDNYLGRVTKAQILEAVREAKGEQAAEAIEHLKKTEMAEKAEELLAGSGWLPETLRTPGRPLACAPLVTQHDATGGEAAIGVETAITASETALHESASSSDHGAAVEPIPAAAE